MTVLRAHFDGRVLVPDEPVDLPRNRSLEVHVLSPSEDTAKGNAPRSSPAALLEAMRGGPHVDPAVFDELEKAIEEGALPVRDSIPFDE
jgi:hypothetical protein